MVELKESRFTFVGPPVSPVLLGEREVEALGGSVTATLNPSHPLISVATDSATLAQILDAIVAEDERFAWQYDGQTGVVNVVETALLESRFWFLNREISGISISPADTLDRLNDLSVELGFSMFSLPTTDVKWAGTTDFGIEYQFTGSVRELVNLFLANCARDVSPFFLIQSQPGREGPFDRKAAQSSRWRIYPSHQGFGFLTRN